MPLGSEGGAVRFTPLSEAGGGGSSSRQGSPKEKDSLLGRNGRYGSFVGSDAGATASSTSSGDYYYYHRDGGPSSLMKGFGHSAGSHESSRPLTFWPLVALIFYTASGGPFGIEGLVAEVGPLLALVGYLLFPLVWSVPEALLTAELASAFPENAGSVAWVATAFGDFPGFLRGALSWMSGVLDNAIYPVLFADYLAAADPRLGDPFTRWVIIWTFTAFLTHLSVRGVDLAGRIAIGVCVFALLPFLVLCLVGLGKMQLSRCHGWVHAAGKASPGKWMLWLNTLFWNLNAFDGTASLAGQVRDPGRTYPRAMLFCIALVVLSYVLPIFIGATASDIPYRTWQDGTFTLVAMQVGGDFLAFWVVLAAAVSNVGLFLAEMSSDAYSMMGMAECGLLPSFFAAKSRHGTPINAITFSAGLIALLSVTCTFDELITMINWLYALAEVFMILAFIRLRYDHPDLPRPYRVPLSDRAATLLMVLPLAFIAVIIFTATLKTWVISGGLAMIALVSYHVFREMRERRVVHFYPLVPSRYLHLTHQLSDSEESSAEDDDEDDDGELGMGIKVLGSTTTQQQMAEAVLIE